MAQVKLSATLPKDDTGANGLDVLAAKLAQRPTDSYLVVGFVTAAKTVVDHDRGNARTPELRFEAIEAVTDTDDRNAAELVFERARTRRKGKNPNQLDVFPESQPTRGPGTHYGDDDEA